MVLKSLRYTHLSGVGLRRRLVKSNPDIVRDPRPRDGPKQGAHRGNQAPHVRGNRID